MCLLLTAMMLASHHYQVMRMTANHSYNCNYMQESSRIATALLRDELIMFYHIILELDNSALHAIQDTVRFMSFQLGLSGA